MEFFRFLGLGREGCFEPSPFLDLYFHLHEVKAIDGDEERQVSLLVRSHTVPEDCRRFVFKYPQEQCLFLHEVPRDAVLLFQVWQCGKEKHQGNRVVAETTLNVSDEISYMRWLCLKRLSQPSIEGSASLAELATPIPKHPELQTVASKKALVDEKCGDFPSKPIAKEPTATKDSETTSSSWVDTSLLACFSLFPSDDAKTHFPLHPLETNSDFRARAWHPLLEACEVQHSWLSAALDEEVKRSSNVVPGNKTIQGDADHVLAVTTGGTTTKETAAGSRSSKSGSKESTSSAAESSGIDATSSARTNKGGSSSAFRRVSTVAEEAEAAADQALKDIEIRALKRQVEQLNEKLTQRERERENLQEEFELTRSSNAGVVGGLRRRQETEAIKHRDEVARLEQLVAKKDATLKELLRKSNLKIDEGNATILKLKAERDQQAKLAEAREQEKREVSTKLKGRETELQHLHEKNSELLKIVQSLYDSSDQQGLSLDRNSIDAFQRKWSTVTTPATATKNQQF
ncbi:unnamed protein product [Amoebophrya sp. A120]|nr:unnamed protein product [Amoebophrya sp. A120]|eukprot:GSA120T00017495001.1